MTLDSNGVESVVEWDLDDFEWKRLRHAHSVIKADIESMASKE